MPSFVWGRDPSEAYNEPYEYGAQEQFVREAAAVITQLKSIYKTQNGSFGRTDTTRARAVWMLQVDALSALSDALHLVGEKRFRVASRLFRDVVETLDISLYFALAGDESSSDLHKWYQDKVIPHRVCREFIKRRHGNEQFDQLRSTYSDLSRYTHRTFRALSMTYLLGKNDVVVYDGFRESDSLVLPQIISFAYAMHAALVTRFIRIAVDTTQMSKAQHDELWESCLEKDSVPRRFGFGSGQLRRSSHIPIDDDG